MQTARQDSPLIDYSESTFRASLPNSDIAADHVKKMKIRELISWSISFGIISLLTGLIIFLKVGITMETVTLILFSLSLCGMVFTVSRIFLFKKSEKAKHLSAFGHLN